MNETLRTLHSLHSTHGDFSDRLVSDSDVETILGASVRAANAGNAQNYAIIVVEDAALMKDVSGYQAALMLVYCVDMQRNIDLAAHVGCRYEYDPTWMITTGTVNATLAAQTAVIAARSLGIDSLITNGIHVGDARRVWRLLELPERNCIPVLALLLGYEKPGAPVPCAGRLGARGTIHRGRYHRLSESQLDALVAVHADPNQHLWQPSAFFEGPAKRANTVYAGLAPALKESGIRIEWA